LRVPALRAVFFSLAMVATSAAPALASSTGGVSAGGSTSRKHPARRGSAKPAAPVPAAPLHAAPVTARSPSLAYSGPVLQRTATGELVPYQPAVPAGQAGGLTGGSPVGVAATAKPQLVVPGSRARYVNGLAAAPMAAPAPVQQMIWSANQIIGLPYVYGGGHASFISPGYDCSGTVSFALHGATLLATPEDSSELEAWGSHGIGRWVSIFSNPGHAYMTVAGMRLDTSAADDPSNQQGPRWRPLRQGNEGFTVRHPLGL
jgi:cell wall-associated NlpC family hydrolase